MRILEVLDVHGTPRPIAEDWTCQRSGHCCQSVGDVVMRVEERAAIEAYLGRTDLPFGRAVDAGQVVPGFVALKAAPCPLLTFDRGRAVCTVYPVRPYNCRRWGCFRPDPGAEPLEPDAGFLGAACVRDRYQGSRHVRRALELMQRKAKRWGRTHGWMDDTPQGTDDTPQDVVDPTTRGHSAGCP